MRDLAIPAGLALSPALLLTVAFLWRRLLVRTGRARWRLTAPSLVAGGCCVALLAAIETPPGPLAFLDNWEMGVMAPLREECVKAAAAWLLVLLLSERDTADGLFAGVMVGLGFTLVENHLFFMIAPTEKVLFTMYLTRTLVPVHLVTTGFVGSVAGWQRSKRTWRSLPAVPLAVAAAVAFHGAGNVFALGPPHYTFFVHAGVVAASLAGLALVGRRCIKADARSSVAR